MEALHLLVSKAFDCYRLVAMDSLSFIGEKQPFLIKLIGLHISILLLSCPDRSDDIIGFAVLEFKSSWFQHKPTSGNGCIPTKVTWFSQNMENCQFKIPE